MEKIEYQDMKRLRGDVKDLLRKGRVRIRWGHIKRRHSGIRKRHILYCLGAGYIRPDKEKRKRYVAWAKINERLLRTAFEVWGGDGKIVLIVTAFWEER